MLGRAGAGGVVDTHGGKGRSFEGLYEWEHRAGPRSLPYDPIARMELLDETGIWAEIIFPGVVGLGGQSLAETRRRRRAPECLCLEIFNDASAELQADSSGPASAHGDPARMGRRRLRARRPSGPPASASAA